MRSQDAALRSAGLETTRSAVVVIGRFWRIAAAD
jgi:hypothetical protein